MTCDDVQIAFEQRQRGVTPALGEAEVEGHLAACASCAAYLAVSRKVNATMDHALATSPAPLDLAAMRARVRSELRSDPWRAALAATVAVVVISCIGLERLHAFALVRIAAIAVLTGVTLGVAIKLILRRETRQFEALARGSQLVEGLRREASRRVANQRLGLWITAFGMVPMLALDLDGIREGDPTRWTVAFLAYWAVTLPWTWIRYRRLKRERALLGD